MAYSAAALTSAETTGFTNDKPMFVVQQAGTASDAHFTSDGEHVDTDKTDSSFPAARAYDDLGSLLTKYASASASDSTKYYNFYFATGITFDTVIILGHNFNSLSLTTAAIEIADSEDFSSNQKRIAAFTISGGSADSRFAIFNLNSESGGTAYSSSGTAQRYSNVQYVRLKLTKSSGSYIPEVGEIILGRRYQLQRNPDLPYNNKNEQSLVSDYVSNSGITKRYTFYRGQAVRAFQASISASAEITVIEDWFNDINEGTRPFVYVETPSSSPKSQLMILDDAGLSFPLVGPTERRLAFGMTEQPPFLSRE